MSGLQSLILTRALRTRIEEAVTATTSLVVQQVTVLAVRTLPTLALDSGLLYSCRPEPWFL